MKVDSDGDGLNDGAEEVAGTSPRDKDSLLAIAAVDGESPNRVVITWPSVSNRVYAITRATNLYAGFSGVMASNIAAFPPENTYTGQAAPSVSFFRIKVRKQ